MTLYESVQFMNNMYNTINIRINQAEEQKSKLMKGLENFVTLSYSFGFIKEGISAVTGFADEMAGATAKVQQMSNELQSVNDIQNLIMQSAQRSGSSYTDIVDTVSRFSAMNDIFGSNNEAIAFTELMNKGLSANGVSKDAQSQIINQLAQSMSTGTMGVEDIQLMSQYIPDLSSGLQEYMNSIKGVEGNLQGMAAQGIITAEDIKNAMFMSSGQIEESFASAPMTFGQIWDRVMNIASLACIPLLGMINLLAQNWEWLAPIIFGVAGALGFLWVVVNATTIATKLCTIATSAMSIATKIWTSAQNLLNAAMAISPIFIIIGAVIALVGIIYGVVGAINHFAGTTLSAAGIVVGAFATVVAAIWNTFVGVINALIQYLWSRFVEPIISIVEVIMNGLNGGFNGFLGGVINLLGQAIAWALSFIKVFTKVSDTIFGTNFTDEISNWQDKVTSWGKNENAVTLERDFKGINGIELGKAWDAGYGVGEQFDNKVSGMFGIGNDPSAMFANGINPEDFARPAFGGSYYGGESDMEAYTRMLQQSSNNTTVPDYQFPDASAYSTGADITNEDFETMCSDVALLREYVSKAVEENEPKEVNYYNTFNNSFTIHKEVDAKTVTDIIVSTISEAVNTSAESAPLLA